MFGAVTHIVSVGSVDGVCTSAALLRLIGGRNVGLQFTQAFTVDKVDVSKWPAGQRVAFVDLAVNNRDPSMTADFVRRIREAGHEIVAVIDEHSREDWLEILGSFESLIVEPQSQGRGGPSSSGELLWRWLANEWPEKFDECLYADDQCLRDLLIAAEAGDRMDFSTHFGGIVNQAVKSAIADDSRRVYLARHFATSAEADATILGWMAEYEAILADHDLIVAEKVDLGNGIVRVSTIGRKVDMTTLMARLYRDGAKVVVCEGEMFVPAIKAKKVMVAFGTDSKSLDLLAIVKAVVPTASGFAQKANVDPEHEAIALAAIRAAIRPPAACGHCGGTDCPRATSPGADCVALARPPRAEALRDALAGAPEAGASLPDGWAMSVVISSDGTVTWSLTDPAAVREIDGIGELTLANVRLALAGR